MVRHYEPGYDPSRIRVVSFPRVEEYGDGWWRSAWEVETTPRELPRSWRLPRPSRELADMSLIVAVLSYEPGRMMVEALSRHDKLSGEEVAYISLVMQTIRASYQDIMIDGYSDHPILGMARA